jgi:hypothetical protein
MKPALIMNGELMTKHLLALGMLFWLAAGCTLGGGGDDDPAPKEKLAARHDDIQAAQSAALDLWDRVIFGEVVSCQEAIPVPEPVALSDETLAQHQQAGPVQTELNTAIRAIRDAADLWNIECSESRERVPLSMAREGRAAALAANEPLAEAARLLEVWDN